MGCSSSIPVNSNIHPRRDFSRAESDAMFEAFRGRVLSISMNSFAGDEDADSQMTIPISPKSPSSFLEEDPRDYEHASIHNISAMFSPAAALEPEFPVSASVTVLSSVLQRAFRRSVTSIDSRGTDDYQSATHGGKSPAGSVTELFPSDDIFGCEAISAMS